MAKRNSRSGNVVADKQLQPAISDQLFEVLGPPSLFADESEDDYCDLLNRVRSAVSPVDVIEELFVRDVVDLVWEGCRLRRLKAHLAAAIRSEAIYEWILIIKEDECSDEFGGDEDNCLSEEAHAEAVERAKVAFASWTNDDPEILALVGDRLRSEGEDEKLIVARALQKNFEAFERIDRLILQAEARRHAALREIDRHREATARRLRGVLRDIEDAKFDEVLPGKSAQTE
jgi:hypothetical protein